MRSLIALFALIALLSLHVSAPAQAAPIAVDAVPGEVIVRVVPGMQLGATATLFGLDAPQIQAALRGLGVRTAEPLGADSYLLRYQSALSPVQAALSLRALPGLLYAEPNYYRRLLRTPNDSVLGQQWALSNIQAFDAWDISTGGELLIAVLDTGVDADHPDLDGKVLPGYNAYAGNGDSGDDNGHGTAVAGLIAAKTDNGVGVAGLCWGCRILPVKVLRANGGGTDAAVAQGIRWAVDNGARVINMSLGGSEDSQVIRDAISYATARGILVVAASGNEQQEGNAPSYPAAYPDVLAVGATGNTDLITGFSNTGDYLDIAAPGVGLWTTLPGGGYGPPNGTSFSSPYVSAAAGLVLTLRPELGFFDVSCILTSSADDKGAPGKDAEYGYGRLNAFRALQLAQTYNGCAQNAPAPQPVPQPAPIPQPAPQPPVGSAPPAFAPVGPPDPAAGRLYFAETGHTLGGAFREYWERNGGLPVFGYPTSEEFSEAAADGQSYTVQYFERHRFEYHPENAPPYNVLLARIGDDILRGAGRDWFIFPKSGAVPGCLYFEGTGQALCEPFLSYWRANGLEFDGRAGKSFEESLALFGQPLSPPQIEEVAPGVFLSVQWFERARFEDHGSGRVLLGLLGNELVTQRGWR